MADNCEFQDLKEDEDHDKNLIALLERCRENKLQLRKQEVPDIGHLLTPDGLKPDPNKVKAMVEMPTPVDKQSLQRLLGVITYLSKFLPNLSEGTEPLRRLLECKDVEWHWDDSHEEACESREAADYKRTSPQVFRQR